MISKQLLLASISETTDKDDFQPAEMGNTSTDGVLRARLCAATHTLSVAQVRHKPPIPSTATVDRALLCGVL